MAARQTGIIFHFLDKFSYLNITALIVDIKDDSKVTLDDAIVF